MAARLVTLDQGAARSYLRLLGLRHASLVSALGGFSVLSSDLPDAIRGYGAWLFIIGLVGFALSVSVLVLPVARRLLDGAEHRLSERLAVINMLTGHALVDEATQVASRKSGLTRRRLRLVVLAEVALFVAAPLLAIMTH